MLGDYVVGGEARRGGFHLVEAVLREGRPYAFVAFAPIVQFGGFEDGGFKVGVEPAEGESGAAGSHLRSSVGGRVWEWESQMIRRWTSIREKQRKTEEGSVFESSESKVLDPKLIHFSGALSPSSCSQQVQFGV